MQRRFTAFLIVITISLLPLHSVSARPAADVTNNQPTLDFPNGITFQARITSPNKITSVVLEYGDAEETCGQVVAKAEPQITPATSVNVSWTWDMRQSGSLPPGAQIWWRWRTTDETGAETVSDQKTVIWLDNSHAWQEMTKGDIRLHWYYNDPGYANQLLDSAVTGLARIEQDAGLSTTQPIDLYIYASTDDLKNAVLYAPSWTGGEAFPEYNIVIIGIGPGDLSWGRRAEVHEMTHVLVGHLIFTCLGEIPTWLNEGLAVYSEGPLEVASQTQLDDAIRNDALLSVRSLSGPFSEITDKANLAYSESESIVQFLIQTYSRDKMTALLIAIRDGSTIDQALKQVYGFNVEGLEDLWRKSIGAKSRAAQGLPTPIQTPTYVPTIVPVSGAPVAVSPTAFSFPTPSAAETPSNGLSDSLLFIGVLTCCGLGLLLGAIGIGVFLDRRKKRKGAIQ